jgi:hypothetical protein
MKRQIGANFRFLLFFLLLLASPSIPAVTVAQIEVASESGPIAPITEKAGLTQDIWDVAPPFEIPAAPDGMHWEDITTEYRIKITFSSAAEAEKAAALGIAGASPEVKEYVVHKKLLQKLQEAGIAYEILGGVSRFVLKIDPERPRSGDEQSSLRLKEDASPLVDACTAICGDECDFPYSVEDGDFFWIGLRNSDCAPDGMTVSNIQYMLTIDDRGDPADFYCGDYEIYLSSEESGGPVPYYLVYDNLGGSADEGFDDDAEDDSDIFLYLRSTSAFNGQDPNQGFYVYISDTILGDEGKGPLIFIIALVVFSHPCPSAPAIPSWSSHRSSTVERWIPPRSGWTSTRL